MILMAATNADRLRVVGHEAAIESRELRAETAAAGRYLMVVGGKIARLIEAEHLTAARHLALHVVEIGERMDRRGGGNAA